MQEILQQMTIGFILIICLIFLDFIFGVAVALKKSSNGLRASNGGFDFKKFLNFLKKFVSPYVLIWVGVSVVSLLITWLNEKFELIIPIAAIIPISVVIDGAAATILLVLGNDIKNKIVELGLRSE